MLNEDLKILLTWYLTIIPILLYGYLDINKRWNFRWKLLGLWAIVGFILTIRYIWI